LSLYERLTQVLSSIPDVTDYEIILVEDCGNDGSWEIIEALAQKDKHIHAIQLSRNFGQHHAITAGLDLCKGDWAIIMDCDLQDQPEYIPNLITKAQEGYDVVCARREKRKHSIWRTFTSKIFHLFFQWLSGISYEPGVGNFRIINRKVVEVYRSMRESFRSFAGQIQWLGFNTAYVDVKHANRLAGGSSYKTSKLISLAVEAIIAYSNKPLRVSIGLGFCIFFISLCVSVYLVVRKIVWSIPVAGWVSQMVSLWFLGGIIIANLGILGIYIGKIYDETKGRPIYAISKKINC
jgi:dolichol-phosphate mannosyltransferase